MSARTPCSSVEREAAGCWDDAPAGEGTTQRPTTVSMSADFVGGASVDDWLEAHVDEYQVGSRTTLDVLNAEAALLFSQETLASALRDQVVDAYQLIASTGKLTAQDQALNVKIYDPVENYRKVRNKWFGTHADTVD